MPSAELFIGFRFCPIHFEHPTSAMSKAIRCSIFFVVFQLSHPTALYTRCIFIAFSRFECLFYYSIRGEYFFLAIAILIFISVSLLPVFF